MGVDTPDNRGEFKAAFDQAGHPDTHLLKYLPHVDDFDLDESQRIELIRTVYLMMEIFVDRAFDERTKALDKSRTDSTQDIESDIKLPSTPNKERKNAP